MNREETLAALIFNRITNYTPVQKYALYVQFGSTAQILSRMGEAESIYHKPFKINGERLRIESARLRAEWELDFCSERGIQVLQFGAGTYPEYLAAIDDPPLMLFAQGRVDLLTEPLLFGIVGARKASNSSINRAFSIARDLSRSGLVVVSGLASGIDYYAHKGALESGGKTIAVLGNGINVVYPKSNRDMYDAIGEKGLLLSEFPIGTEPLRYNFPKRNRIISGLSKGILVVEASAKSGALITAGYALDQGREVMALPGKAGSDAFSGNNHIIKEGAHLVEDAEDICELFGIECSSSDEYKSLPFSSLECNILTVIGDDLVSIEDIERNLESPVSKIASALTHLELKGAVVQYPGKHFTRAQDHG
jgi:DNA processing protein